MTQILNGDKIVIHLFKSNPISSQVSFVLIDHVRDGKLLKMITKKELGLVLLGTKLWTKSRAGLDV